MTMGAIPSGIRSAVDYAAMGAGSLEPALLAHLEGGSGHDRTAAANLAAFAGVSVVPRILADVTNGSLAANIGGQAFPHPVMLAPLGSQALYHPGAEAETAKGAAAIGACLIASTMSSLSLEDIAAAAPAGRRWFQLYFQPTREATADLVQRAVAAGYGAIMVTLDTPLQVPSFKALSAGFVPDAAAPNLAPYDVPPLPQTGGHRILNGLMQRAPTWADFEWLLSISPLPVWAKGVMHADDARELKARGAAGVVVSNHGGRSLDGAPASLAMLPAIRAAVGPDYPLLFDGGIRSGVDIFKAIALGADAVLVGRLQAYALNIAGGLGVGHMVKLLLEELEIVMALAGTPTLPAIRNATLWGQPA